MRDEEKANRVAESLSSPRGRRKLAWDVTNPMFLDPFTADMRVGPWEGYPDSPPGTLEIWDEMEMEGCDNW